MVRRSLRGLALATFAAAALAACGTGTSSTPADAKKPANTAPAKLLWQTKSPDTYKKLAAWAIDEYRKTHPNVTIDTMGDDGNVEKTVTAMVAGLGPDVILSWGYNYWQLAAKGQLYNHNELIKDWKKADIDDFVDFQWKGFVIPGTNFRFAMPMYINSMVIYYNKALFQKRGQKEPNADWTLDDYTTMLKQMTFQDGDKKVWGATCRRPPLTASRTTC
jgi:multiple sugar transport system substrate-binding protein